MTTQESTKRGPGRPGKYANAKERVRAWRERQKALIAEAQRLTQRAEPIVVERRVEKIIEIPVVPLAPAKRSRGRGPTEAPNADKLGTLLIPKFAALGGEARAKKLRSNAARVAGTAREILAMFGPSENVPETEKVFLQHVVRFFDSLNASFEVAQRGAKTIKARVDAEMLATHEARMEEIIRLTFAGHVDLETVRAMAEQLQTFASRKTCDEEARRRGVDRAYFPITREIELRAALKSGDVKKIAREIAEIRLETEERGRQWTDQGESCYLAGWADFLEFRSNGNR